MPGSVVKDTVVSASGAYSQHNLPVWSQDESGEATLVSQIDVSILNEEVDSNVSQDLDTTFLEEASDGFLAQSTPHYQHGEVGPHNIRQRVDSNKSWAPPLSVSADVTQSSPSGCSGNTLDYGYVVSVSAALESLSDISISRATQFVPGTDYLGARFHCRYLDS